jgi:hypothetical protein
MNETIIVSDNYGRFNDHFNCCEVLELTSVASLLDPRFKEASFKKAEHAKAAKYLTLKLLASINCLLGESESSTALNKASESHAVSKKNNKQNYEQIDSFDI